MTQITATKPAVALNALATGPLDRLALQLEAWRTWGYPLKLKKRRKSYNWFRRRMIAQRAARYPMEIEGGLLSFLTPAYNTDPQYLEELAQSVFGQEGGTGFEWVLVDNGSTRVETRACLERLGAHPCVKLLRVEQNRGIIGGMRTCLEAATGRYVLPLDSDDLLTPDCARIMTHFIRANAYPAILYSDEDKYDGTSFHTPHLKSDHDPIYLSVSVYIAHLGAIDRRLALEYGLYDDPSCEGSHDWDSFTRFVAAGHVPTHIPEILYAWRQHDASTSANVGSKPFVIESQRSVIEKYLRLGSLTEKFEPDLILYKDVHPNWRIKRRKIDPRPVTTILIESLDGPAAPFRAPDYPLHTVVRVDAAEGLGGLAARLGAIARQGAGLVHLLWGDVALEAPDWPWEPVGLFDRFGDVGAVGGPLSDGEGRIIAADHYFGFGWGCDTPHRGHDRESPGYWGQLSLLPHTVSAVSSQNIMLSSALAAILVRELPEYPASPGHLGPWIGAIARRHGFRVAYTPFFGARQQQPLATEPPIAEQRAFLRFAHDLVPDTELLSRWRSLRQAERYRPAFPIDRALHLTRLGCAQARTAATSRAPAHR